MGLPDSPHEVLASMGNYVFDADALVEAVTSDADLERLQARHGRRHRAGVRRDEKAGVYDFKDNDVPGSTDRDRGYWRDVGTLASYYAAHMDLVSPLPIFNLYNFAWPIYTSYGPQPPAKLVQGAGRATPARRTTRALARRRGDRRHGSAGRCSRPRCAWSRGRGRPTRCCMTASWSAPGAVVRNAILDKGVVIPDGGTLGVDPDADRARGLQVHDGITVMGKDERFPE